MTNDTLYKTFESFTSRIITFKKHVYSALKYFHDTPSRGQWDSADVLSEIADIVEDYKITIDEIKSIIDEDIKNPYYKYLINIYKAMLIDKKYPYDD